MKQLAPYRAKEAAHTMPATRDMSACVLKRRLQSVTGHSQNACNRRSSTAHVCETDKTQTSTPEGALRACTFLSCQNARGKEVSFAERAHDIMELLEPERNVCFRSTSLGLLCAHSDIVRHQRHGTLDLKRLNGVKTHSKVRRLEQLTTCQPCCRRSWPRPADVRARPRTIRSRHITTSMDSRRFPSHCEEHAKKARPKTATHYQSQSRTSMSSGPSLSPKAGIAPLPLVTCVLSICPGMCQACWLQL